MTRSPAKRILLWQWGRRGAGPRIAADLARGFDRLEQTDVLLCLSAQAEILCSQGSPIHVVKIETYTSVFGLFCRILTVAALVKRIAGIISDFRPDMAVCAMPGFLDIVMTYTLKRTGVPIVAIIHDAQNHPGDGYPFQAVLQRHLIRQADHIVTFSTYVAEALRNAKHPVRCPILALKHPPFGARVAKPNGKVAASAPFSHGGVPRILMFGRLLAYKGLDLLAEALPKISAPFECRIVGLGPESAELRALDALPNVTVENRWVPEDELVTLVEWADLVVLPYREASQSGVGALAIANGRYVVATKVGGLIEQFGSDSQATLCEPNPQAIATALKTALGGSSATRPYEDPEEAWETLALAIRNLDQ